ncbi:MAG: XTP/dITP diphosphatase [Sedimentisphaeraceae bacterium JB056]
MKILLATTNPGKKRELEYMLDGFGVELCTLADFDNIVEVEEDGQTFAENARKKALGYASQSGLWTIADDSGLEVDYLDGAPGIHSARFSGVHKDHSDPRNLIDHENIKKLLSLMEGVEEQKRTARFVCSLALAKPGKVLFETFGAFEGRILNELRGEGGFGYDPVFFVPEIGKTAAEMSKEEKNSMSHRHNALVKLLPELERMVNRQ